MQLDLMKPFFKDFMEFPLKTQELSSILRATLKKYYMDIKKMSNETVNYTSQIETVDDNSSLLNSRYIPKNISGEIKNCEKMFVFKAKINKFDLIVKFVLKNNEDTDKYHEKFKKIYTWLKFIYKYSDSKQKKFILYLYLSEHKKLLPESKTEILDQVNCNTAVTYACAVNGECLIYRKEEWFKVLIHETMHSLCMDFSGLDYKKLRKDVKSIFPLKSEFEISESYSEFWATFLNTTFTSTFLSKNETEFLVNWEVMIYIETLFSMFQVSKILDFLEIIEYENLFKPNTYRQRTHVFEYYILKLIFLMNYNSFFKLCYDNNSEIICFKKTPKMLEEIFKFIKNNYKSDKLIKNLKWMGKYYNENKGDELLKTMRMSIFS